MQNALADLTNQQFDSFSAELPLRFDFSRYQSIILKDLMRAGKSLMGTSRSTRKAAWKEAAKLQKGERLRDKDPWT